MKNLILAISIILLLNSCSNTKGPERIIQISTNQGTMLIQLYDETPLHRDNFIALADSGFFNGVLFHRVINTFMIQGGDPDSKQAAKGEVLGNGGPSYRIPAEFNKDLFHKKGVIAAAREGDKTNPNKESSGSQFYIVQGKIFSNDELDELITKINKRKFETIYNDLLMDAQSEMLDQGKTFDMFELSQKMTSKATELYALSDTFSLNEQQRIIYTTVGGTPHLDGNYTVFGEVIKGMEVIDKIAQVETDENDRPLEDIKMKIKVIK